MGQYHTIEQGECLIVLAKQYGFTDYNAIWNHPQNRALKSKRQNPNILAVGDRLFIPNKQEKQEARGTGQTHQFRVSSATVLYKTILKDGRDQPLANTAYTLDLGSRICRGATDGKGLLQEKIPVDAESAQLTLRELGITWMLKFGHLDPIDTVSGVQQRLKSLGYDPGEADGTENDGLRNALRAFQKQNGIPVDGSCTPETRAKIKAQHGC